MLRFHFLPHSHLLIQKVCSYCFLPKKKMHAKYVKNCFFFLFPAPLFTLHSVHLYFCLCVSFPLFSHSFLPSAAVVARNESTIWLTVFLKGLHGENSIFMLNSKKATKDLHKCSLRKSADNCFLRRSRVATMLLVLGGPCLVNIVQLKWNEKLHPVTEKGGNLTFW